VGYDTISRGSTPKQQLLSVLKSIKEQYERYLNNPHCPHLLVASVALAPPRKMSVSMDTTSAQTNIGNVDSMIPHVFHEDNDGTKAVVLRLDNMSIGARIAGGVP
jgi:hypothetical protein